MAKDGDNEANTLLKIIQLQPYFNNLVLILWFIVSGIYGYVILTRTNLAVGIIVLIISAIIYPLLCYQFTKKIINQKRLLKFLSNFLPFFEKNSNKLFLLKSNNRQTVENKEFNSVQELIYCVEKTANIDEKSKTLIIGGLSLKDEKIASLMTSKKDIVYVNNSELLGPLVLDELHKTGHSCFPVIDQDLDHVIGILDITDLLTLNHKRSLTAKNVTKNIVNIYEDKAIIYAFKKMVDSKQHLLIVRDHDDKLTGIITLEDIFIFLIDRRKTD
jgi:CBS domain containing-hemolysin-like protein